MKIAIVGSGISGLTAAHYLSEKHEVHVFEASDRLGGHTNTIRVPAGLAAENALDVDTGFIVFNDRTYPNFIRLLRELGVGWQDTQMSFSVRCDADNVEYRGADLNGFFAQRSNLFRPKFYRMLRDLLRFNRVSREFFDSSESEITVAEFFQRNQFGREFIHHYFLPMGSAIWSCPTSTFETFPVRFIVEFYHHHGLLSVNQRPQWHVVRGGSNRYIAPLTQRFAERIQLNSPVLAVQRQRHDFSPEPQSSQPAAITLSMPHGEQSFDHVVFACHSDQALAILGQQATPTEREMLTEFPYERNLATLHTDVSLLPRRRRAWACWNYWLDDRARDRATVTYNMNQLQTLDADKTLCVTLNCEDRIAPDSIIKQIEYHHPLFTLQRRAVQRRHRELIGPNHTSFCGAYWGNGFHEDGVRSALTVVDELNRESGGQSILDYDSASELDCECCAAEDQQQSGLVSPAKFGSSPETTADSSR